MHRVTHYRRADDGIEAISLDTDRAFPRHAHDEFGVGVIVSGAHRSWSGCGTVDARAGDTIMVNPGEVHDGLPLGARAARSWRMLYLTPALVAGFAAEEGCGGVELAHPAVRDARLAAAVERLFARVVAGAQTPAASIACDEALALLVAALLARRERARDPDRARAARRVAGRCRVARRARESGGRQPFSTAARFRARARHHAARLSDPVARTPHPCDACARPVDRASRGRGGLRRPEPSDARVRSPVRHHAGTLRVTLNACPLPPRELGPCASHVRNSPRWSSPSPAPPLPDRRRAAAILFKTRSAREATMRA